MATVLLLTATYIKDYTFVDPNVDEKYIRPTEVDALIGDPSKIERELNWKAKTLWKELAELMVTADIQAKQ